jgi:glycosyltransferase involved in cell wall biosynthesis
VARGHDVTVVHVAQVNADLPIGMRVRCAFGYLRRQWTGAYLPHSWFKIHPLVRLVWNRTLHVRHIPDGDVIVATAWQTAEQMAAYPAAKGRKLYLIQGLETWSGSEARVLATWRLPFTKIVIARWLLRLANELGENAIYIPNGLDFTALGVDVPPDQRMPRSLLMLYHHADWKGSLDGLAAVDRLKGEFPDLSLTLFGVSPRPRDLPDWVTYLRRPSPRQLRALYNGAAIFLSPSRSEGWALPPAEAMSCGAALVATEIGGHLDYAIPGETALLSPPGRPELLADKVQCLLLDPSLRVRLAQAGNSYVRQFTWQRALDCFETALGPL